MNRIFLNELAVILAIRNNCDRQEAIRFINAVGSVIQEGLKADGMVKVRGLGTFKVVEVDARESINVNTGERVVIDSHQKLAFLPDDLMKELVNKPFSMFETVVLNDGVTFNDVEEDTYVDDSNSKNEEETPPVTENFMVEFIDEAQPEETTTPENPETPEAPEAPETPEDPESQDSSPTPSRRRWWQWLLLAFLLIGIAFAVFLLLNRNKPGLKETEEKIVVPQAPIASDTTATSQDSTNVTGSTPTQATGQEQAGDVSTAPKEYDWVYYDTLDVRLSTGAYAIVGYDHSIRARQNDNTRRIAMREAGSEQMSCYIEVYNGIKASTTIETGTEIRIPKLVTKKKLKTELKTEQQNNE